MLRHRRDVIARAAGGALLGLLFVAPPASAAGPPPIRFWGTVEAGVYRQTEDSYKYGDFTGLKDDAWYPFGNIDLNGRAPWDSGDTWNFRVRGYNIGLDSPWVRAEGGMQGLFDLWFEYQEIPHYEDDTASLVFNGRGTKKLTLPTNWVPGMNTAGFDMTVLQSDLSHLNIYRDRMELAGGAKLVLPEGFELVGDYDYQHKKGRQVVGAVIGNTGGNPRAALVPESIDYQTHDVNSALRYADETMQFELGYQYSKFDDIDDYLSWQNPFSAITGWDPSAGYAAGGYGRKGLAPDNVFNQIHASGGYNLPFHTRVAAHGSFAWYRQNDDFLPYTVNPTLAASITTPLPRDSAQGKINAATAGVRVTSRPIEHLRVNASYRFDNRDNDTPRDVFIYIPGDSQTQDTIDSERARRNLPFSYRLHQARVDLGYEVYRRTEVTSGFEYQRETRSWTETDHLNDYIFRAGLHSHVFDWADLRVDGTYWNRDAGDYFYQAPFVWGFSSQHVATVPPDEHWENLPPLRKFNYTDFNRGSVDARLSVMPVDNVSLGISGNWTLTSYDGSELGLRERQQWSTSLDASWNPTEAVSTYAWYTHEQYQSEVRGRQFTNLGAAFNSANDWRSRDFDQVDTVGVGAEWTGLRDRLRLRTNYAFSWAKERIDTDVNPGLTPASPLPDARTYIYDVGLQAEYKVMDGFTARFGYLFEMLDVNEWAYDGVSPTTLNNVLGLGQSSPDYTSHLFAFSVEYDFDF